MEIVYKTVITETVCKSMIMEPGCQEPNDKNEMSKMKKQYGNPKKDRGACFVCVAVLLSCISMPAAFRRSGIIFCV